MKKSYLIFLTVFCSFLAQAQTVDIPDQAFKNKLLTYPDPIDDNADGEIQVSEALAITELNFSFCNFNNIIGIQAFANLESLNFGSYTTIASPIDLSGMASLKSLRFTKCTFSALNFEGLTGLENLSIGYAGNVELLNFEDATNLKAIYFYSTHFTSIDLSHAIGLKTFSAQNTDLETINLTGLVNLETFRCDRPGNITELNLTDLVALKKFELEGTTFSNLDFQHNTMLEEIDCGENQLTSINVSQLTELRELSCNSNLLTSIDLSNNPELEWLSMGENQLTDIDLSHQRKLKYVDASYNLFTTLDFSALTECHHYDSEPGYYINDNPNLKWVNLKNGKKDFAWTHTSLNCPNLTYICLDEEDETDQRQMLEANGIEIIEINTYCSFVPGGNYNTITGTFTLDLDNNGCDASDVLFPNVKVSLVHEEENQATAADTQGRYNFYIKKGDYTLSAQLENPYFTITPAITTLSFEHNDNSTQTQHFCVVPNGIHQDLEIAMMPLKAAQPGADAYYRLVYKNKGNQMLSGNISLNFDGAIADFVAADPAIGVESANQLQWSYADIKPFETRSIDLILHLNSTLQTPAVAAGDILRFETVIGPVADDETPTDNSFTMAQTVGDSTISNDKICLQGDTVTTDLVGGYVHYMIRFQNTGEVAATNVVVKDLIDPDQFDVSTLQVISASHQPIAKVTDNKIEFIFENINLSAAIENEPTSTGYVAFKIKTKDSLAVGDTIENQARVYFDYLFPIQTNTATSTISELLANTNFQNVSVSIMPNPTKNLVHIASKGSISSVELFDMQGRLLETQLAHSEKIDLDLTTRTDGIYFVKIISSVGIKVEKIIKE